MVERAGLVLVEARARHVCYLARHMRAIDAAECRAMGLTPNRALRRGIAASTWAVTAMVDGRPHAMFGLVIDSVLGGTGIPWFLATDRVLEHGREMLAFGRRAVAIMRDSTPRLANLVSADNTPAIRLLRRWGFEIEADTIMINDMPFHHFSLGPR
jgi:ribosomal protein S18 acetylase RimI-like enzyme